MTENESEMQRQIRVLTMQNELLKSALKEKDSTIEKIYENEQENRDFSDGIRSSTNPTNQIGNNAFVGAGKEIEMDEPPTLDAEGLKRTQKLIGNRSMDYSREEF